MKQATDSLNRLTQYMDELGKVINYSYNAQNQLTTVSDYNGAIPFMIMMV
ncbi:RHS repeat domain-containing protein [Psychromonas sp. MME2]